jgi:cysteine synthase
MTTVPLTFESRVSWRDGDDSQAALRSGLELAGAGAFLAFDGPNRASHPTDWRLIDVIADLIEAGFADRVLVGADSLDATARFATGGGPGAAGVLTHTAARVGARVGERTTRQIMVENPRRDFHSTFSRWPAHDRGPECPIGPDAAIFSYPVRLGSRLSSSASSRADAPGTAVRRALWRWIGDTARVTMSSNGRVRRGSRGWANEAIRRIEADANRSADTHLHIFPLPAHWGIDLYLKDESVHPTGSLKHRLARSLFLYGLCNGWITEGTTIVEASSGSTAVSEAYFARFLRLPFVAVMPASTSPEKIALIEAEGGSCHLVEDPRTMVSEAQRLAVERDGHFLDQFTYAERATDWRGNNNIAESIFTQLALEQHPIPTWVVVGAGTGGTSATIGRYTRLMRYPTRLCVVDPEDSIFYSRWTGDPSTFTGRPSRIEGIGRQRVEPSFLPDIVDRMIQIPDAASIATMRLVSERTGRSVGGSTGTNVWGALLLAVEMLSASERGSIVTLICDGGARYAGTYYSDEWVSDQGLDLAPYTAALETFLESGAFAVPGSGT